TVTKLARGRRQITRERFVRPEDKVQRSVQHERGLPLDHGERCVGREPNDLIAALIANVIAAGSVASEVLAVIVRRAQPDSDARKPADRLNNAKQLRRAKYALVVPKARGEISDTHASAASIGQNRGNDGRVAQIFGPVLNHVVEQNVGEALLLAARK